MSSVHVPILVHPIVQYLMEPFKVLPESASPHWIVDCTLGGGGHTGALLRAFEDLSANHPGLMKHKILAIDQDSEAVARAKTKFEKEIVEGRLETVQGRFGRLQEIAGDRPVLGILADLGFSSDQLDRSGRGLSFQSPDEPLDMRLDPSGGPTCYEILQRASEEELENWLSEFGEERFSRRIASAILARRREGLLPRTTGELVEVVIRALPRFARHGRIHAATRTFQALRIVVNDEIGELETFLDHGILCLKPGGRVAVLSFHSLEDRRIKHRFLKKKAFEATSSDESSNTKGVFVSLEKKPIQAGDEEVSENPRSRSAKLRVAERVV